MTSWIRRSLLRWRAMAGVGVAMMFHDRSKLAGGLVGVLIATILASQQGGTFLSLINRNTMLMRHSGADLWIVAPGTQQITPGSKLAERVLHQARATDGVDWAAPLLLAGGNVSRPNGGSEQVTILGVELPAMHAGPWNVVAGDPKDLAQPSAMFFEDADREKLGGLNIGSVREVNGHRVQAVGFTWGLLPFGPSYAFASYDTARELSGQTNRDQNVVLVGVRPGEDAQAVATRLRGRITGVDVHTSSEMADITVGFILKRTPIGVTFGISTLFGLIVGFAIVSIAMFSAVVDHIREFGTLKAIGANLRDLAKILFVQSLVYAGLGGAIGLTLMGFLARGIRSPNLPFALPTWFLGGVAALLVVLCVGASGLALLRLRKVEPGIVFRA